MERVEIWTNGAGMPRDFVHRAQQAEQAGFDGITIVDSQNLSGDPYVALALAGAATENIKLATSVTNPYTRHPAVTACAIATVHAVSGGRAVLGIGRGDSALAHLGYAPASIPVFKDYLERLQGYLNGEEMPFASDSNLEVLNLATTPTSSKILWLRPGRFPKITVDVAATGPRVIRMAAKVADRITFAVGADVSRMEWGIRTAREAREQAGMDPDGLALGAYVNMVVHDDPETARRMGEGSLSVFGRFQAMFGEMVGPASEAQKQSTEAIHDAYDMTRHTQAGSAQTTQITPEFASEFGIFGPSDYCIERIKAITVLGVRRLVILGGGDRGEPGKTAEARDRFLQEVLPKIREA